MRLFVPCGSAAVAQRNRLPGVWLVLLAVAGMAQEQPVALASERPAQALTVRMPASREWVNTHFQVKANEGLTVRASGVIQVARPGHGTAPIRVGPQGSYHFLDVESGNQYPLPAAGAGPAPVYALIGRIGENGRPFFIGRQCSVQSPMSGELWLGINDSSCEGNSGEFTVTITSGGPLTPVSVRQRVLPGAPDGLPRPGCRVVIFYVDGLRPDVVEEMSAIGHLPHITENFLTGGTKLEHAFTVFPSDTITSNGTLWTGVFSDRHGMKAQVGFNRRTCRSENYLSTQGPVHSDRFLMHEGLDRGLLNISSAAVRLLWGRDAATQFRNRRTSETVTLRHYVTRSGHSFGAGVMPVMNELAPALWTRYLADEVPPLGTQRADRYVDEANAAYAIENLFRADPDVAVVWLPETDTVSHHEYRGQFGMARRTIAEADRLIGEMVSILRRLNRLENTYLLLISDHGHLGGRNTHLRRFDITNEFFHQPARLDEHGRRVGGGLGLSVRQHRYFNPTHGDRGKDFVFVDAMGSGAARIYLPKKRYGSRDWSGPNTVAELLQYQIRDRAQPTNLIRELLQFGQPANSSDRYPKDNRYPEDNGVRHASHQQSAKHVVPPAPGPIDLVLARIDDSSVLVASGARGFAVIDRRLNDAGHYECRYRVVGNVRPADDGGLSFNVIAQPRTDPLRLVGSIDPALIGTFHSERDWLQITLGTIYPDSIVTMSRHLLWQPRLRARAQDYAPDLVVTASPGWQFNTYNEPGTAHGHPFVETMRMSFFVSGPKIRRGAMITDPVRAVDLLPTVLEMAGVPYDANQLDGRALRSIYSPGGTDTHAVTMPLVWSDVDLDGWAPIRYAPRAEYPVQPKTVNHPNSFWDVHNLARNALSIPEVSVNRLFDDTARLAGLQGRPTRTAYRWAETELGQDGISTPNLQLNKISLGDYSWYSTGNLQRLNNGVDWLQQRAASTDAAVATPLGARTVLGTPFTNGAIDAVQYSAWELRRVGTLAATTVLDRWLLNGVENTADRFINRGLAQPAERTLPE